MDIQEIIEWFKAAKPNPAPLKIFKFEREIKRWQQ